MFSCTKGVLAICAYLLVQDGRLDLDAPVARLLAGVRTGGQGRHPGPLAALAPRRPLVPGPAADARRGLAWDPVIAAIERQAPLWRPGTAWAYHTMTYGWLVGEVIRRVSGESVGSFVRRRLAEPLGLRFWIGLPPKEREHVAWLLAPLPDTDLELAREIREADAHPERVRAATMGGAFAFPADGDHVTFNDPDIQAAEVPGANGIGDARSLARLYAACVHRRRRPAPDDTASVDDALVERSSGRPWSGFADPGPRFGTGFLLASPPGSPLLGPRSFGHGGAGGELAFADDTHGIGFAYVNNQMGGIPDERASRLVEAVRSCLDA